MALDIENIERIYKSYGFESKKDDPGILCFLYKKGRYFGVDIIALSDAVSPQSIQQLHDNYSRLGYAVNVKNFDTNEEIEKELFKSFFSYDATIARLKRRYNEFVAKQKKSLLGNPYEYIDTPFEYYDSEDDSNYSGLLDTITGVLERTGPQLLILEAAAGYGKTCSAHEILHRLVQQTDVVVSPLFTELSKNRSAKIFRYILLDEIDLEFPSLNSELVIHEVKTGRIPIIIDGFDELLDKANVSNIDVSNSFDEIETMLDTIGSLLEINAKVILTTRKTAIFSGSEFENWYQRWSDKFVVSRFSLKEPRIKDWLGTERFETLRKQNVPIQYIANPVILTYLKNIPLIEFTTQIENPDLLVRQYFSSMLERERERQNLIITVEKQYEIFKNVAKMLLEFDIVVESKEFFKEIIKDQNYKLLEYTRTLYSGPNKPSLENLVDTLATHALLDRKGRDGSQIGFINDFVLGILIGEIICESAVEKIEKDYSFYMLDLACTAYKVQNKKNKFLLWEKVDKVKHKLQPLSIFNYDISLRESLVRDYTDLSVWDMTYFNINFKDFTIENSVFVNCYFKSCTFDINILKGVSFIECTFDYCHIEHQFYLDSSPEISTIKCKVKDCQILGNYIYHQTDESTVFSVLEKEILKSLLSISSTKSHHIAQLVLSIGKPQQKSIYACLEALEEKGFIRIRGFHIDFNINKLNVIKSELGV